MRFNSFPVEKEENSTQEQKKAMKRYQTTLKLQETLVESTNESLQDLVKAAFVKFKNNNYFGSIDDAEKSKDAILAATNSKIDVFTALPYLFASLINPLK